MRPGLGTRIGLALKTLLGVQFRHSGYRANEAVLGWLRDDLPEGHALLREPYATTAHVQVAISAIAEDSAAIPWKFVRRDDPEQEAESPEIDAIRALWKNPNAMMMGDQLAIGSYLSDLLFGEWFWYYPLGPDVSIDLLDPRCVKSRVDPSNGEVAWTFEPQGGGQPIRLDPESFTHNKRWNPYNPLRGLPKIASVIAEVMGDAAAAHWNARFFNEQNGVPAGLLAPTQGSITYTDEQQREDVLKRFNDRHGGKRSVGLLPPGWTYEDVGLSQRDMDFPGLRDQAREIILAAFGVPPFIAGVLDKANYANAREQRAVYFNGTITRFLSRQADSINYGYLPRVGLESVMVRPDWESVRALVENLSEKLDSANKLWAMGVPLTEVNTRLDLGLDTDSIPQSDVGFVSMSVVPVEQAVEPPLPILPPAPVAPPTDEPEEPEEPEQRSAKGKPHDEGRRRRLWKAIVDQTLDIEIRFDKTMRRYFLQLEQEMLRSMNELQVEVESWGEKRITPYVLKQNDLFDIEEWNLKLISVTEPIHRQAIRRGGENVIAFIGFESAFNVRTPSVAALLTTLMGNITGINTRIEAQVMGSLADGLAARETLDQLRDRVSHVMGVSLGRSRTIARTETGFAYNGGRQQGMKQAGVTRQQWLSSRDADVRDTHAAEDGNIIAVDGEETFPVTGLRYPQDPTGPAGEIINCRCTMLPVMENER